MGPISFFKYLWFRENNPVYNNTHLSKYNVPAPQVMLLVVGLTSPETPQHQLLYSHTVKCEKQMQNQVKQLFIIE